MWNATSGLVNTLQVLDSTASLVVAVDSGTDDASMPAELVEVEEPVLEQAPAPARVAA